ncbi:MAG: hypothetical protein ACE5E7_10770 [Anaerolineae bacterium]
MDAILNSIGLTSGELSQLVVLGVILLVGLFLLRIVFKLTATLFRVGCFAILFIVAAVFILNLLN